MNEKQSGGPKKNQLHICAPSAKFLSIFIEEFFEKFTYDAIEQRSVRAMTSLIQQSFTHFLAKYLAAALEGGKWKREMPKISDRW